MGLTAKASNGGGDFEISPAGNHIAICYGVVDLGEHESEWQGKTSLKHRVRISWELCDELMADGRPFSVSKEYTVSLNEKANLRHDLESWRGRSFTEQELEAFDLFTVLGAPAMVNVVHKPSKDGSRTYAVVASVTPIPKGVPKRNRVNDLIRFSMEEPGFLETYAAFPEWLQNRINLVRDETMPEKLTEFVDDDVPF